MIRPRLQAATQPRRPAPSRARLGALTFLVSHGGRRAGRGWEGGEKIPGSCVAGGAGKRRALAPRARPLLFPAARAWGAGSRAFAPTPANGRARSGGVGGAAAAAANADAHSRFFAGPRRALRPSPPLPPPSQAGADVHRLRARAACWDEARAGHVTRSAFTRSCAAIFLGGRYANDSLRVGKDISSVSGSGS